MSTNIIFAKILFLRVSKRYSQNCFWRVMKIQKWASFYVCQHRIWLERRTTFPFDSGDSYDCYKAWKHTYCALILSKKFLSDLWVPISYLQKYSFWGYQNGYSRLYPFWYPQKEYFCKYDMGTQRSLKNFFESINAQYVCFQAL